MKKDRFDLFAKISLWITAYYFFSNFLILPVWWDFEIFNFFDKILMFPFYTDLFTWHIFGVFSLISLIVKIAIYADRKVIFGKDALINLGLHIFYTIAAFGEIWWIFENSF